MFVLIQIEFELKFDFDWKTNKMMKKKTTTTRDDDDDGGKKKQQKVFFFLLLVFSFFFVYFNFLCDYLLNIFEIQWR